MVYSQNIPVSDDQNKAESLTRMLEIKETPVLTR